VQKAKKDTRLIGKLKAILNTDIEHIERVCVSARERDKKKREEKNERTTRKRVEFGLHLHLNDRSCDHSHKTVNAQHNIIYPREGKQSREENEKAEKGKKGTCVPVVPFNGRQAFRLGCPFSYAYTRERYACDYQSDRYGRKTKNEKRERERRERGEKEKKRRRLHSVHPFRFSSFL
jgi:glutaredoxin